MIDEFESEAESLDRLDIILYTYTMLYKTFEVIEQFLFVGHSRIQNVIQKSSTNFDLKLFVLQLFSFMYCFQVFRVK